MIREEFNKSFKKWIAEWVERNKENLVNLSAVRLTILASNINPDIGSYMSFKNYIEIQTENVFPSMEEFKLKFNRALKGFSDKLNLDIVEIIKDYGHEIVKDKIICPFHGDTDASLQIYKDTNSWFCFGCRKGGDAIKFIALTENKEYRKVFLERCSVKEKVVTESTDVKELTFNIAKKLMEANYFKTLEDTNEILIYENGMYYPAKNKINELARHILEDRATIHLINEIVGHIQGMTYISRDLFDNDPYLICLENGLFNIKTMKLEDFSAEKYFLTRIPIQFDADLKADKIATFFSEILTEIDITRVLQLFGYCLLRDHPIHKAFMFVGDGGNGKSTTINLLKAFIGEINCSGIPLQELDSNRFATASLYGKLANLVADIPHKQLAATGKFKMITGQDLIGAEKKFKDHFTFKNYAKLIFSTNQIPKTKDDTVAFWRRWIIINFPNSFIGKEADKNLLSKLTSPQEMSGLFNLATLGLNKLLTEGEFYKTPSPEEIREKYIRMSDSQGAFIMDEIEVDVGENIPKKELYSRYCSYCREKNYPMINEQTFHKNLPQHVVVTQERTTTGNGREYVWKGIKFAD